MCQSPRSPSHPFPLGVHAFISCTGLTLRALTGCSQEGFIIGECSTLMFCSLFWPEISERRRQLQLFPSEPPCQLIRKSRWDDRKVKAKLEPSRAGSSFLRAVQPCRRTSVLPEMRSSGRGKARRSESGAAFNVFSCHCILSSCL